MIFYLMNLKVTKHLVNQPSEPRSEMLKESGASGIMNTSLVCAWKCCEVANGTHKTESNTKIISKDLNP